MVPANKPAACIDLNADLGEGVTDDESLLEVVSSANVACGYHAGDVETMTAVCERAAGRGVVVGAQVSYDDREGFGRRELDVAYALLRDQVAAQVSALDDIARQAGSAVAYVKAHGALYHRVAKDPEQARALLDASGSLPVLAMPGALVLELAAAAGRTTWREGFPDRRYEGERTGAGLGQGGLVSRDEPDAVLHDPDEVAGRAVELARSGSVDSVCVHGDSPGAVATAHAVRAALEAAGFDVRPV
jgi:UPF0271 protein